MKRIISVATVALALATATPALAGPRDASLIEQARLELQVVDHQLDRMRNQHLRADLEQRLARIEFLLARAERADAREEVRRGSSHRGWDDPRRGWNDPRRGHDRGGGRGHHAGMNRREFQALIGSLQRESFANHRLERILRLPQRTRLTSQQAAQLVQLLPYASHQKQAVLALHPAVVDPFRYDLVVDQLAYSSHRREVRRALNL